MNIYIITFLCIVYYVLTILFPSSDLSLSAYRIYPQSTMMLLCLISMFYTLYHKNMIKANGFLKAYVLLYLLAGIYILYPYKDADLLYENMIFFFKSFMAISFTMTLYVFLLRDSKKTLNCMYIIYTFQVIYALYSLVYDRSIFLTGEGLNGELLTFDSNAGFTLITCVPFALMLPNKRIKLYLYGILVLACIYSGQRSAALAAVASFPICYTYIKGNVKKIDILLFVVVFVIFGIPFLQDAVQNILERNAQDAAKDKLGSGRSVFWAFVWDDYWNGDLLQILFGKGTNTVPNLLKIKYGLAIGSHNGLLDHLYSYGFIGIFLYLLTIFNLYKYNKIFNRYLPEFKNIALSVFLVLLVKCTTSHGYWDITVMPISLVVAVLCAKKRALIGKIS